MIRRPRPYVRAARGTSPMHQQELSEPVALQPLSVPRAGQPPPRLRDQRLAGLGQGRFAFGRNRFGREAQLSLALQFGSQSPNLLLECGAVLHVVHYGRKKSLCAAEPLPDRPDCPDWPPLVEPW